MSLMFERTASAGKPVPLLSATDFATVPGPKKQLPEPNPPTHLPGVQPFVKFRRESGMTGRIHIEHRWVTGLALSFIMAAAPCQVFSQKARSEVAPIVI